MRGGVSNRCRIRAGRRGRRARAGPPGATRRSVRAAGRAQADRRHADHRRRAARAGRAQARAAVRRGRHAEQRFDHRSAGARGRPRLRSRTTSGRSIRAAAAACRSPTCSATCRRAARASSKRGAGEQRGRSLRCAGSAPCASRRRQHGGAYFSLSGQRIQILETSACAPTIRSTSTASDPRTARRPTHTETPSMTFAGRFPRCIDCRVAATPALACASRRRLHRFR